MIQAHFRHYNTNEGVEGTYRITLPNDLNVYVQTNNIYQFLCQEIRTRERVVCYQVKDTNGNEDWIDIEEAEARQRLGWEDRL